MPWIQSHSNLARHHKLLRFAFKLDISPTYAVGILHCLWHSVIELREDGDITPWTPKEIAHYSGYEGDPEKLYEALFDGWLDRKEDGTVLVHDWLDYADRYLDTKYRTGDPNRLETLILKHSQTNVGLKSDKRPSKVVLDKIREDKIIYIQHFNDLWNRYPRKLGKKEAFRHFIASVKTDEDITSIKKALDRYIDYVKDKEEKYIKQGSSWFNNWQDWVEYEVKKPDNNKKYGGLI